ncbi:hypothetical protein [Desulfurella sp.]|uniref:hypothetical protein n=1 Tax=Desulfurella sp. TaxID=1962857 RepID=UPI0025BFA7D6|nr:hypothetical protein [Desulfurella sp.]
MREYIMHLLHKQKGITFNDLLKKTNLKPEALIKIIFDLSKKDKVYFLNSKSIKNCSVCFTKNICKKRRQNGLLK